MYSYHFNLKSLKNMKQRLLVSSNFSSPMHRIGDEVASVFGSSAVDRAIHTRIYDELMVND